MLVRWLASVCTVEAAFTGSHHDRLRAGVFVGLDKLRSTFTNGGTFLTNAELKRAEYFCNLYHTCLNGTLTDLFLICFGRTFF